MRVQHLAAACFSLALLSLAALTTAHNESHEDTTQLALGHDHDHEHGSGHGAHAHAPSREAWSGAMASCAVVSVVTFVGVLMLAIPTQVKHAHSTLLSAVTSGFAAGTLLCAAVLLLLAEAMHLIDTQQAEDEHSWVWAAGLLSGVFSVMVVDTLVSLAMPHRLHAHGAHAPTSDAAIVDKESGLDDEHAQSSNIRARVRVAIAILVGDAFHNVTDGIFIGAAFSACNASFGWVVLLSTVAHELPQELSDYLVLTSIVRLAPKRALAFNFISGLTVFVGAILALRAQPSPMAIGIVLAVGAGVYLYTALSECVPRLLGVEQIGPRIAGLASFIIGATAVGLVLLNHEHCELGGAVDAPHHDDHHHHSSS